MPAYVTLSVSPVDAATVPLFTCNLKIRLTQLALLYFSHEERAVIVHGKPTRERYENPLELKPHEANWLPWLGRQLTSSGVEVAIPALPKPYHPVYEDWEEVFATNTVDNQTSLIGHSAGAEFILRWLSVHESVATHQVILVAPYKDYNGKYGEFSEYSLDTALVHRTGRITVINSLDDDKPIQTRAHELAAMLPGSELIDLEGFGHFRIGHNMRSEEFPFLRDVLLR